MKCWLLVVIGILIVFILVLVGYLFLIKKSIREIEQELCEKIRTDTNTLISVSPSSRYVRKLAAQLNVQLRALRKERRRLQNGDLILKETITNISHDLRTPLTAICGYLDLLDQEEKSEEVNRYLSVIRARTDALKTLTEELLRYSVITSGSEQLDFENINLNAALEESIAAFYAAFTKRGIVPKIKIPEKQVYRRANRTALRRVFSNVLNNALKYSDGDLTVILSRNGEITFTNTATELDEVQVEKLFDRFYTVESARNSTGLGLSISKALMEQMNGTITAKYACNQLSICIK